MSKVLVRNEQHRDFCFQSIDDDAQYLIIAHVCDPHSLSRHVRRLMFWSLLSTQKRTLSVHSIELGDDTSITSQCIVSSISIDYQSATTQIARIPHHFITADIVPSQWDCLCILFEDGHFGIVSLDIFNEFSPHTLRWILPPDSNRKLHRFMARSLVFYHLESDCTISTNKM